MLQRAVRTGEIAFLPPADLDGSGELDAADVQLHRDFLIGKITSFPAAG